MTETLARRIKEIAREVRWLGGDDNDPGRVAIYNTLYDIGQEVAALTAEREALRAENTRLREVLFKHTKGLKRLARHWQKYAGDHYCQTYNPEMGKGLKRAADNLEGYVNDARRALGED